MEPIVLITGGSGFLGRALVAELLDKHCPLHPKEIRIFDPARPLQADHAKVRWIQGDIRSAEALLEASRDVELVFHCAAVVDWGRYPDSLLEQVNVVGTDRVIAASRARGVRALVHTSTLDVIYTGRPLVDGNEETPYPDRFVNTYCRTKAESEQRVREANGPDLKTAVIRPCAIYGEADPYHVPPLVEMCKRKKMLRIGNGRARSQFVYVGNVAHAHVLAGLALLEGRVGVAGEVFFATDIPPANFFDFLAPFVESAGTRMPSWRSSLPRTPMYALGATLEAASKVLRPLVSFTPTLTRFAVDFVCLDFTIRTDKASRAFGYTPKYGPEEAFRRTRDWFAGEESESTT